MGGEEGKCLCVSHTTVRDEVARDGENRTSLTDDWLNSFEMNQFNALARNDTGANTS